MTVTDAVASALDELIARLPSDPLAQRQLQFDLGLAWVHHPVGMGGLDAPRSAQLDVNRRIREAGAAPMSARSGGGVGLAGPTMAVHGSPEINARLLRRAFTGEDG